MTDTLRDGRHLEGRESPTSIVDVDVHEMLTSVRDLAPYLEEPWRSRIEVNDGFKGPPGNPYSFPQPTGVAIQDAVTDDGSPAGSKLEMVQEQVLDRYGIQRAILISLFHPTDHQIQPEFATALAFAYNDWVLENWLERDDRLRMGSKVPMYRRVRKRPQAQYNPSPGPPTPHSSSIVSSAAALLSMRAGASLYGTITCRSI